MAQQTVNTTDTIEQFRTKTNANFTDVYSAAVENAWSQDGNAIAETGVHRYPIRGTQTLVEARATVGTAPSGGSLGITIKRNGSSIATLSIAAAATSATTGAISIALADGDYLTADVGTPPSTPGANLVVTCYRRVA